MNDTRNFELSKERKEIETFTYIRTRTLELKCGTLPHEFRNNLLNETNGLNFEVFYSYTGGPKKLERKFGNNIGQIFVKGMFVDKDKEKITLNDNV